MKAAGKKETSSTGEMPLPALYILMSVLFFLSGCFWVFILRKNGTEQAGLPSGLWLIIRKIQVTFRLIVMTLITSDK